MFAGCSDNIARIVRCAQQLSCHGISVAILYREWSNEEL